MDDGALGKEYADGELICRQGKPGEHMFVVQAGQAEVFREEAGDEVTVGMLMPGDVFGEMAIFDRQPRSATVRAKGNTRVLTLDKRAFLKRVNEDPSFAYRILQIMSRHIRSLDEELALFRSVATKVFLVRCLYIVSRDKTALYEKLKQDFADDREVEVVLDRRSTQRRRQASEHKPERRRGDRRRPLDGWTVELSQAYRSGRPHLRDE